MNDPIVDEVRRVRDALAARFNYDLDAIFRDIKEQEKKSGHTFVSLTPPGVPPNQALQTTGPAAVVSDCIPSHQAGPSAAVGQGRRFLSQTAEPPQDVGIAAQLRGMVKLGIGGVQITQETIDCRSVIADGALPQSHRESFQLLIEDAIERRFAVHGCWGCIRFSRARRNSFQTSCGDSCT